MKFKNPSFSVILFAAVLSFIILFFNVHNTRNIIKENWIKELRTTTADLIGLSERIKLQINAGKCITIVYQSEMEKVISKMNLLLDDKREKEGKLQSLVADLKEEIVKVKPNNIRELRESSMLSITNIQDKLLGQSEKILKYEYRWIYRANWIFYCVAIIIMAIVSLFCLKAFART